MLEQYPIIQVWDDHEAANNGWYSSAENHNWATQGNWFVRKNASKKAFFEWNPVRKIAPGNDSIIHRNFKFGNLFNLIMIDTRLEGRDSSLGALIPITNAYMNDTNRRMLGPVQLDWLKNQLSDNSTQWKIVGEQIMIAKLALNVLITTEVLNGDQWDGYPAERRRVFRHISQNNIKDVVFLSGDLHTSWAADLPSSDSTYVPATGAGSVATEFIGGSVTTPGFIPVTGATIQAADPWFKYAELSKHGYLLFDINQSRVQGDFIHVSNIDTRTYTTANDAQWQNLDNERHLRIATTPLNPNYGHNPPLVSWYPTGTGIQPVNNSLVVFSCYPNPTSNEVHLQLYIDEPGKLDIAITDLNGKVVYSTSTAAMPRGMNNTTLNIGDLSDGVYMITINTGKGSYSNKIIKSK
jgi:alkaline phosphatase D